MNLKFMLLSAMLLTNLFYNKIQSYPTQINNDGDFGAAINSGQVVIAVGGQAQRIQLNAVNAQLDQVKGTGSFPSVQFYFAFIEDIPMATVQYQLPGLKVLVFKDRSLKGKIYVPTSATDMFNRIQSYLG